MHCMGPRRSLHVECFVCVLTAADALPAQTAVRAGPPNWFCTWLLILTWTFCAWVLQLFNAVTHDDQDALLTTLSLAARTKAKTYSVAVAGTEDVLHTPIAGGLTVAGLAAARRADRCLAVWPLDGMADTNGRSVLEWSVSKPVDACRVDEDDQIVVTRTCQSLKAFTTLLTRGVLPTGDTAQAVVDRVAHEGALDLLEDMLEYDVLAHNRSVFETAVKTHAAADAALARLKEVRSADDLPRVSPACFDVAIVRVAQHLEDLDDAESDGAWSAWLTSLVPQPLAGKRFADDPDSPAATPLHGRHCSVCLDTFGNDARRHVVVRVGCDHPMHPVCYATALPGLLVDGCLQSPCPECGVVTEDVVSVPVRDVQFGSRDVRVAAMQKVIDGRRKRREPLRTACPNYRDSDLAVCWRAVAGLPCEFQHDDASTETSWQSALKITCAEVYGRAAADAVSRLPHLQQSVAWRMLMEFKW